MIDAILLGAVRCGSEGALRKVIDKYSRYICTVIRNTVGMSLTHEDVEETASDVFFALWQNADRVDKLRAWLAATARNKAKNKLRDVCDTLPLDERLAADGKKEIEDALVAEHERDAVKAAILSMANPDRDIFLRHYYASQTVAAISAETGMTEAAIKHRLVRGRKKLRVILNEEVLGV